MNQLDDIAVSEWIKWNEKTGDIPSPNQECVGLWFHTTKHSRAGCHAQCFVTIRDPHGFTEREGLGGCVLRDYAPPAFWMPIPNTNDR